jgi:hypothetical protein
MGALDPSPHCCQYVDPAQRSIISSTQRPHVSQAFGRVTTATGRFPLYRITRKSLAVTLLGLPAIVANWIWFAPPTPSGSKYKAPETVS